ncbi:hypothetical protein Tco_1040298 [Tanacetum coccineum]
MAASICYYINDGLFDHVTGRKDDENRILRYGEYVVVSVPRLFIDDIVAFYEGYYQKKGVTIIKGNVAFGFTKNDHGEERIIKTKVSKISQNRQRNEEDKTRVKNERQSKADQPDTARKESQ